MPPELLASKVYDDQLTDAVAVQCSLAYYLQHALSLLKAGKAEEATAAIESAQRSSIQLGKLQHDTLAPVYFNKHIALGGSANAAARFFKLPEMLNNVLEMLDTDDLLRVELVNHTMRQGVDASSVLKRRMFLLPATDAQINTLPLEKMFGSSCVSLQGCVKKHPHFFQDTTHAEYDNPRYHINFSARAPLPRVGPRICSMLITQPPIQEMRMTVHCCIASVRKSHGAPPLELSTVIKNDRGVTLGELLDCAAQMLAEHHGCPMAEGFNLAKDGTVSPQAHSHESVPLSLQDPRVVAALATSTPMEELAERRELRRELMRFSQARKAGKSVHNIKACKADAD